MYFLHSDNIANILDSFYSNSWSVYTTIFGIVGIVLGIVFPLYQNNQNNKKFENEINKLDTKIKEFDDKIKNIKTFDDKIENIKQLFFNHVFNDISENAADLIKTGEMQLDQITEHINKMYPEKYAKIIIDKINNILKEYKSNYRENPFEDFPDP